MITTRGSTSTSTNSSITCRRRKLCNYSILSRCVILFCIQLSQRLVSDVNVHAFSPSSSFINTGTHTQTLTSSVGNLGEISIAMIRKNHISVGDKIHRSSSSSRENRQKSQSLQASFNEILDSEINNNHNNKSNIIEDDNEYCMPGDSCSLDHHEEEIDFLNSIPIDIQKFTSNSHFRPSACHISHHSISSLNDIWWNCPIVQRSIQHHNIGTIMAAGRWRSISSQNHRPDHSWNCGSCHIHPVCNSDW